MPTDAVIARYAPGVARRHARRATSLAVLAAVLAVAVIVISVSQGFEWTFAAILVVILGGLSVFALLYASASKETWAADDRLAIAVSEEGVVLPSTGLILWSEIASIKILDSTFFAISKALTDWTFGSTGQSITVYTTEIAIVLARADTRAKFSLVADVTGAKTGFSAAIGSGMSSPTFAEMADIVTQQAKQHCVPVIRG
jgi:hypothetical protein